MADNPNASDTTEELQAVVGAFIEQLTQRYGHDAVKHAVEVAVSRPPGRPKGWLIDDWPALKNMYRLLRSGEEQDATKAARASVSLTENHSTESTIRRLRDKYRRKEQEIAERVMAGEAFWAVEGLYEQVMAAQRALSRAGTEQRQAMARAIERMNRDAVESFHQSLRATLSRLSVGGKSTGLGSGDKPRRLISGDETQKNKSP